MDSKFIWQGSIYWRGRGEASPPPKKVLLKKKITAISNKDLFSQRFYGINEGY